jgi:hypothetical protein
MNGSYVQRSNFLSLALLVFSAGMGVGSKAHQWPGVGDGAAPARVRRVGDGQPFGLQILEEFFFIKRRLGCCPL